MKIKILASASQDLIEGYRFYESQAEGVGAYFLDSLYSDIDSLTISAGVHSVYFGKYHRLLSKRSPSPFTTGLKTARHLFMPSSIVASARHGPERS